MNQQVSHLQEIRSSQFGDRNAARPAAIHRVEYPCDDRVHVARMELGRLLQERQTRMRIDDVLHQRDQILGLDVRSAAIAASHYVDEA